MGYITLTTYSGQPIHINMDLIEAFGEITTETYEGADKYVGMTYLIAFGMANGDEPYIVKETPAAIQSLIEAKWRW